MVPLDGDLALASQVAEGNLIYTQFAARTVSLQPTPMCLKQSNFCNNLHHRPQVSRLRRPLGVSMPASLRQRGRSGAAARSAAQTGDTYAEKLAAGSRYASKQEWDVAASAFREAIGLKPDEPAAYYNLGSVLAKSGHPVEATRRLLEAKERLLVGSERWAVATAAAFEALMQKGMIEVAKPEWWNDEGLKALSARVVRAAPDDVGANRMRAAVLSGQYSAWEAGPRSAAELREAATHYERAAALQPAPALKAELAGTAARCRTQAGPV